ncbi:hypothetical protein ACF1GS_34900 [Streptomyces eurythermus]|uniref:hypothetical protein n=1 Tax=Streptomyces eurythermus TaxID=42237 RepID=UPI0036FE1C42
MTRERRYANAAVGRDASARPRAGGYDGRQILERAKSRPDRGQFIAAIREIDVSRS